MKKSILFASFFIVLASCSSTKKRPMKITTISDTADVRYENANSDLLAGKMERALLQFSQARDLAYSVDNADLLCRINLSAVAYKVSSGNLDALKKAENFIDASSAEELLKDARFFATKTEREEFLSAVCTVYDVRLELARGKKNVSTYEKSLLSCEKTLEKEPFYLANLHRTLGDVQILSKKYEDAQKSYEKAAELHTKNRYVSEIGTDWYGVARCRSLSGDKNGAIEAIENALKYDRDAENTSAIASDYFACAKILVKGKTTADEKKRAREFANWAAKIYKSGGFPFEAEACEKFAAQIK